MTKVLEIAGLYAGYGGVPVVRDLTLHVDEGEVVALLGPNGAGKTTTMLTAGGVLSLLGGDVMVFGRSVKGRKPQHIAREGLSLVPEDQPCSLDLRCGENLRLGSKAGKGGSDLGEIFHYFPALEALLDRRAGLLSGGEQQMLAVGRALLMQPKLLMVDEMSLGLAPVIVKALIPVLRQIADEKGCGVLLVEQHVQLALEVAERAYVLAHGNLMHEGPAADLRKDRALLESSYLGEHAMESTL